MRIDSFSHEAALLTLPPVVSGLRVRFAGSEGRGRFQIMFCNNRARPISGGELERPRVSTPRQQCSAGSMPTCRPGRVGEGAGAIWIDLTSGEARLVPDAAG